MQSGKNICNTNSIIVGMISRTTRKEIKRVKSLRRTAYTNSPRGLYFIGHDNKAYFCNNSGMTGVKEMDDWNKELKRRKEAQQAML